MENQGRPKQLSDEEYRRIMALPERKFRLGGGLRSGRYDEAAHRFYETTLDANGQEVLTGRTASVNIDPAPAPEADVTSEEATVPSEGAESEEGSDDDGGEAAPGFFARFKVPILVAAGVLVVAICAMAFMGGGQSTGDTPGSGVTASDAPSSEVSVIQTNKPLLIGHVLTLEDVEEVQLGRAEYEEVALFGRNLYTYNDLDKLVGSYVTKFVPAGQYLEQADIQAATPFPINPWAITDGNSTSVKVPLEAEIAESVNFGFGSVMDLTVRRVTANQVAVGGEGGDAEGVAGVTHTSTVGTTSTTEEITIGSLVVCDLLNSDGESIYESYCAYIGIPLGQRLDYLAAAIEENDTLMQELTPVYVVLRVSQDQAAIIGDLSSNNVTTSLKSNGDVSRLTNEQIQFSSEAQAVKTTLYQAQAVVEKKMAEHQAEMQKTYEESKHQQGQEEAENG